MSAFFSFFLSTLATAAVAAEADLVLRGGMVYTVDAERSRAAAVAVDDGRIVAVGADAELAPFVGASTEVVELDGRLVLPGFHDSHVHPISGGLEALSCALHEAPSVEAILAKVRDCVAATGEEWIVGAGWNLSLFPAANPHQKLLDAIAPDRPIFLQGADGHSAWVSSKALALAGIDRSTPDLEGAVIERDPATGEPSGTLREGAMSLVSRLVPAPSAAARRDGLRHALRLAASFGITSVIDPGMDGTDQRLYEEAAAAGELTLRVLGCIQTADRGEEPPRPVTPLVRRGCVKIFVDGVLEGETAALLEPYAGPRSHRGTLHVEPAALAAAVTRYDADGVQVHLHTIGDRAVRVALDAIEAARRANGPRDRRHHLAHLQLVHPDDVRRFAALDVIATFQALWAFPDSYIEGINLAQVGAERVARMYPIGSIHRAGGRIAGGSDWPVTSMNPLLAIEVALTRQDPARSGNGVYHSLHSQNSGAADGAGDPDTLNASERVDLDTMIAAFTAEGARLMRDEAVTGSIEVGKAADLVVLERDLFAIPPGEIGEVAVALTVFDGRVVYRRPATP